MTDLARSIEALELKIRSKQLEISTLQDKIKALRAKQTEQPEQFMRFFAETFLKEEGPFPIDAKSVRANYRVWKRDNPDCKITEPQLFECMRMACGNRSTDKIFYGIRVREEAMDLNDASFISHMP